MASVRTRTKVEEKDEKFLVENLTRHAPKWRDIGAALRFLASELDSIETIPELTDEQRLEELLHRFVRWPTTAHPHAPTMEMFKQGEMVRLGISNIYDYRDRLPSQLDLVNKDVKENLGYEEFDKAMKEGSVDYQGIDSVIVGIGGAGKTHTLAMILNEPLPIRRVSTPCTRAPVRTIAQVTLNESCGVLERVEGEKYFSIVADTTRALVRSTSSPALSRKSNPTTSRPTTVRKFSHSSSAETLLCHRKSAVPPYIRELEEKMNACLHRENPEEDTAAAHVQTQKLLYKSRWNRLTDSGGQPQFMEVLPIFIHHISLGIIVIKLNERLDAFPMIEFFNNDGLSVGAPYKSCYSQEQVVRYFMRALISQGERKKDVKFLFIGTHRDRMGECKNESIQEKNEKLNQIIILFNVEENVIYNLGHNPIFPINAKNPDEEDKKVMKQVQGVVVKSANVSSISIPIRWFAMELALLRFVQETKEAVLLESKCLMLMANFHFNRGNFNAALNYLHRIKHIFYYESGGKKLIVADISVIQIKLSELVSFSIELCTSTQKESMPVEYKWIKFSKKGILHISCLEEFPNHYIKGVFTPKDLMHLFTSLCIVSELNSKDEEYLMPCVLAVEDNVFCNPEPETQPVPAMVVEFPGGGPMLGSYCGLVCYLITTGKWKLVAKLNGEPAHISRSSAHFEVPDFPGKVTINDPLSSFFLVTVHCLLEVASKLCPRIRETILTGIRVVSENLHYLGASNNQLAPVITILCPCGSTTPHPAKTITMDDKIYWMCPYSQESKTLTYRQRIWLRSFDTTVKGIRGLHKSASASFHEVFLEMRPHFNILYRILLKSTAPIEWHDIGIFLDMDKKQLDDIQAQKKENKECLKAMLTLWLERIDPFPTKSKIIEVLKELDFNVEAKELQEKLVYM